MNKIARGFIEKAKGSYRASKYLFQRGLIGEAASASYYVLFFTAQALLNAKGVVYRRSHSAVINTYGIEFAKSNFLNSKFHHYLIEARKREIIADYKFDKKVTKNQVRKMLTWAKEFLEAGENFLIQEL